MEADRNCDKMLMLKKVLATTKYSLFLSVILTLQLFYFRSNKTEIVPQIRWIYLSATLKFCSEASTTVASVVNIHGESEEGVNVCKIDITAGSSKKPDVKD